MEFVSEEMKDEWDEFLEILNIKSGSNNAIPTEGKNGKENIDTFFKSKGWLVKWNVLEETLFDMGKGDVVEHIKNEFLYTRGNNFQLLLLLLQTTAARFFSRNFLRELFTLF